MTDGMTAAEAAYFHTHPPEWLLVVERVELNLLRKAIEHVNPKPGTFGSLILRECGLIHEALRDLRDFDRFIVWLRNRAKRISYNTDEAAVVKTLRPSVKKYKAKVRTRFHSLWNRVRANTIPHDSAFVAMQMTMLRVEDAAAYTLELWEQCSA